MISIQNLGINFGQNVLFENVTFQFNPGNRYGIVGANGSGKSTLLRVIAGTMQSETGSVVIPSGIKLGFLQQNQFEFEKTRIIDVVLMGDSILWQAFGKKEEILSSGKEINALTGKELAELEMTIADRNGYQAETDAGEILAGLGIATSQQENLLSSLSGGYKLRVLLAQILFSKPEVLLLDEPTNHLDILSIAWLEEYLIKYSGTLLLVSHDHVFLNNVSTHIVDIDYQTIKIYPGNYDRFTTAKLEDEERIGKEIGKKEKKRDEMQKFIDRFQAKATKARQASSKAKQIEKIDIPDIVRSSRIAPRFRIGITRPSGRVVLKLDAISKAFGEHKVLNNLSLTLQRGERIAVIGPNGIGKSTLLKIITGQHKDYSGNLEFGHEVYTGYFAQDHKDLIPPGTTPYEWLYQFGPGETIGTIRGLLGMVLLSGDDVHKSSEALSGGEAARLIFSRLMLEKPNLLLLDEPTNHLDLESIEALETALKEYPGTIIFVSHNRHFVKNVATSVLELKAEGFDFFNGKYDEYLEQKGEDHLNREQVVGKSKKATVTLSTKQKKLNQQEIRNYRKEIQKKKKQVNTIEENIAILEKEIKTIESILADPKLYRKKNNPDVEQYLSEKISLSGQLKKEMQKWERLQANIESMSLQVEN